MCGRYAPIRDAGDLASLFGAVDETAGVLAPDHNVAPTDPVPIVRCGTGAGAGSFRWPGGACCRRGRRIAPAPLV